MKKLFFFYITLSIGLLCGCGKTTVEFPEPPDWVTQKPDPRRLGASPADGTYNMDTKKSVVHWVGKKKWPYTEYKGTLNLKTGKLNAAAGKITAGDFTVDMLSLDIVSLKNSPKDYEKMMDRLKNYFFYVNEYPTIFFSIASVSEADKAIYPKATHVITGKLTIKDATNSIKLPATIVFSGNEVKAYSRFSINRNDYNIVYNESSFFGGLGDAAIKDSIDMGLELVGIRMQPES